jgi:hypothetical protein
MRKINRRITQSMATSMVVLFAASQSAGAAGVAIGQTIDRRSPTPFSTSTWTPSQNAHVPGLPAGHSHNAIDLDLASTTANISLRGVLSTHGTATINLGGVPTVIHGNDQVTPAQYIAVKEVVVRNGVQTLILNSSGQATGGSFVLNGLITPVKVTGLDIPSGVIALDNATRNRLLGIGGDLTNNGTIYIFSTIHRLVPTTGLLLADNLFNNGLITSTVDSTLRSLLPTANLQPTTNITLAAINNIVNTGVIQSSGTALLATAYGTISNVSTPTNPYTPQATIIANNNLSFSSGRVFGSTAPVVFNNSGLIASSIGSVNFSSPVKAADLIFNFINGTVQATADRINIRYPQFTGSGNVLLNGGTYSALAGLNIFGGTGNITADTNTNLATSAIIANALRTITTGNVDIVDDSDTGVYLGESTGHNFSLLNSGSIDITSIVATGNVTVVADADGTVNNTHLNVAASGNVSTTNGSITLQDTDAANGTITLGFGSNISSNAASGGDGTVTVAAGALPSNPPPTVGLAPVSNVQVNDISNDGTHTVFWGDNSVTALPTTNVLNINRQNIIFSAATSASQITLAGGLNITADSFVPTASTSPVQDDAVIDTELDDADEICENSSALGK